MLWPASVPAAVTPSSFWAFSLYHAFLLFLHTNLFKNVTLSNFYPWEFFPFSLALSHWSFDRTSSLRTISLLFLSCHWDARWYNAKVCFWPTSLALECSEVNYLIYSSCSGTVADLVDGLKKDFAVLISHLTTFWIKHWLDGSLQLMVLNYVWSWSVCLHVKCQFCN